MSDEPEKPGPLTGLLAAWAAGQKAALDGTPFPRPNHCGGANLFLSRVEAMGEMREGTRFDSDPHEMPDDGRVMIRVRCKAQALTYTRENREIRHAICGECAGREAKNRKHLAAVVAAAAEPTTRTRRRRADFDE